MRKGHVFALEGMGIFFAWMILLLFTWSYSANVMNENTQRMQVDARERMANEVLDSLIQKHSIIPWKGCAMFSLEKKRELPYIVEGKCIEGLSTTPMLEGVARLVLHTPTGKEIIVENPLASGNCTSLQRPILLDGIVPAALEVSVCE
jgi:hypothetical protein